MLFYNPTTKSEPDTGSFKLISGVKTLKGDRNVPTPFLDRQNTPKKLLPSSARGTRQFQDSAATPYYSN